MHIAQSLWAVLSGWSTGSGLISLGLALSPPSTSVSSDFMALCKCLKRIILTSLYLVEGLVCWDWPFTWWTDQLLSFSAWHCWLGYLTRKIVPNMTYNVFGGTLNPTLLLDSSQKIQATSWLCGKLTGCHCEVLVQIMLLSYVMQLLVQRIFTNIQIVRYYYMCSTVSADKLCVLLIVKLVCVFAAVCSVVFWFWTDFGFCACRNICQLYWYCFQSSLYSCCTMGGWKLEVFKVCVDRLFLFWAFFSTHIECKYDHMEICFWGWMP